VPTTAGTRRVALLVEYDGTDFAGSQAQPQARTVQTTLEAALLAFTGEQQRLRFAGRTDAGVHARGQVVTLDTSTVHAPARIRAALNRFLPPDVVVRAACEVALTFDPRRAAQARTYSYAIEDGRPRAPLTRRTAWQLAATLDVDAMAQAASMLPHALRDWSAFAGLLPEGRSPVRTLLACEVRRCEQHRVVVTVQADAFLPHQVRRMVGALSEVGTGRRTPQAFAAQLDGAPGSAGPAAPPQGLTLERVQYAQGTVEWDDNEDIPPA
jgi:tRNA pseudouridine38-40 synthase